MPGIQGRGRISVQPGQPEIEIPGLGSSLRLVRKKREKEQSPGVPGTSGLSGEWMGPGMLAQHSFQALAQTYFSRVRRRVHNLQHINR